MKLRNNFVITNVVGNNVAVSMDNNRNSFNGVIRLNETGKRIFELIQEGKDEDGIIAAMLEEYDATEALICEEVAKVIDQLVSEGVLER